MITFRRFLFILLFAALLPVPFSWAQVTSLPMIRDTITGQEGDQEQQLPLPEPTDLHGGWWHYLEVKETEENGLEKLKERINALIERLHNFQTELPQADAADARAYINLIESNLGALPDAQAQPTPKPPAPPAYAESYTLQKILNIAARLRAEQAQRRIMSVDVEAAERVVNNGNRTLDTKLAAYLDLPKSDSRRALLGLQIMAERTSLILTEERLRVNKGDLLATEVLIKQLNDEQTIAKQRLQTEADELKRLQDAIKIAEQELQQARTRNVKAHTAASKITGNEPGDKATGQFRQQRAINAEVEEASAKVLLNKLLAEYALVNLLLDTDIDIPELRENLLEWETELKLLRKQAQVWQESSERERERTSTAMTAGQALPQQETTQFVGLINQNRFNLAQETLVDIRRLHDDISEVEMVMQLVDEQLLIKEGRLRDWLAWLQQSGQQLWQSVAAYISQSLFKIGETPVTALGLLRIVMILTIAWLLSYWLRRALNKLGARGDGSNLPAYYTVGRLSHYLLVIIGFLVGLSSIGMDFTNFALVAGALAIGIGFGLQEIVNNFISGLILLFERSLKVGDFVRLSSGITGEVKAINVRSTQIKTNENIDIVVPNSEFMNTNVINYTLQEPYMRVHYPFRVKFGTDKERVRRAGLEAAEKLPHTLSGIPGKNPQVWLVGYGENGYNFELVVWLTPSAVKRPQAVNAAYYWELETALRNHEVEVPVPQRDVHLRSGFEELKNFQALSTTVTHVYPEATD